MSIAMLLYLRIVYNANKIIFRCIELSNLIANELRRTITKLQLGTWLSLTVTITIYC